MENEIIKLPDGRNVAMDRSIGVVMCCYTMVDNNIYILANKRGAETTEFKNAWNLPSGYLNWDETGEQGAIRETYEETGVQIPLTSVFEFEHSTSPFENRQNVIFRYAAYVPSEFLYYNFKPMDEKEVSEVLWIHEDDVDNYEWAFHHDKVIKRLLHKIHHPGGMLNIC